jgi:D-sedoheptulose 7-phosphate isomerase
VGKPISSYLCSSDFHPWQKFFQRFAFDGTPAENRGMGEFIESYIANHQMVAAAVAREMGPGISRVGKLLCERFAAGGKLLTFGNGGSAADAQHLAEELIGRFQRTRRPLPAVGLTADGTALTCIANDFGYSEIFARQVQALANPGDVVCGFSTSGNSENVLRGLMDAKLKGAVTVGMLGKGGGKIGPIVDHALIVPASVTANVQEMHVMIVHLLCDIVDRWAVGE